MRKYIALIVGLVLLGSGLWWAALLLDADIIPAWMVAGSVFLVFLGAHLLWVTLREWRQVKS
jgi:hypothetical protein